MRNGRGFTLIELLVVIAIIAILAAMLFAGPTGPNEVWWAPYDPTQVPDGVPGAGYKNGLLSPFLGATNNVIFKCPIRLQFQRRGRQYHHRQGSEPRQSERCARVLKTVVGARTMALNPQTHEIYLPAATPSFRVLVYVMDNR